jgi:outer membrane protein TolC
MTWSILDHGRSRNEREAASLRGLAAKQALADVRSKAKAELAAIEIEIEAANERLATYGEIQGAARVLVDKSRLGYTEGYGTLVDVLEATRSLREIEQELAEARLELNLAEVARYEATGALASSQEPGR